MQPELKPVTFLNREGFKLFGMLHSPLQPRTGVGIIILTPGVKNRVAPHRLYVKMARRFCDLGFHVLRFDPKGSGDSEGDIDEKLAADLYGSIQVGRFVNDTIDAMDWMKNESEVSRFILAGLCGGAITGLLTGAVDDRVHLLLGLGIPVILDSASMDQKKYMTMGQLEVIRNSYLRKMLDIKAWSRFLSLKSDYHLILKAFMISIRKKAVDYQTRHSKNEISTNSRRRIKNNFNQYFPLALHNMLSSRNVVLIFSEVDRLVREFQEQYLQNYAQEFKMLSKNFQIYVIKNANHILSFAEWQDEMLDKVALALESLVA